MRMTAVIPQNGRRVICGWAALPCAILAPFFFWRGMWNGLLFLFAAILLVFAAYARTVSFVAAADEETLSVISGIIFPTARYVPRGSICGTGHYTTPLLALAGCRVLVLYTPGAAVYIFGLSLTDTNALCAWARQNQGGETAR